jgi:predicted MPP superfamily phosphohydrolase
MFIEERKSTYIGRLSSTVYGVWEWVLVMLLIYLIIIYVLKSLFVIPLFMISLFLLTIPLIGIYAYYNAHKIVVKERLLTFEKLDKEYNIIHLSDVHFGSIRHETIIKDIFEVLKDNSGNCDLAIISGDLADGSCIVEEDDFIALKDIDIPIIFTSGNHDYYPGLDSVHKACRKAGMIILENEGIVLDDLNIYGLSFSFDDIDMPSVEYLSSFIREDKINILNYHVPMGWEKFVEIGFDLQLSGHTHGGQFYPVIFFAELIFKYNMGLFKSDSGKYLHVTTGVGSMDIPMRWGTNSELVILRLKKSR